MCQVFMLTGSNIMTYEHVVVINGDQASHARATPNTVSNNIRTSLIYIFIFTKTALMFMNRVVYVTPMLRQG